MRGIDDGGSRLMIPDLAVQQLCVVRLREGISVGES